ncbi:P1 family peptidase [Halalkalibacillus halophilus]|uniref:P1 family peptidase n=1 Tax=Halalkalibacillus halophilus TaxID=392827 RepID=UPI0004039CE7|nr:P1 family peptidase [Halalkalibacillus halophilus]
MNNQTITAVPGLKVGHAEDQHAKTGCTVIISENGATCGVDVRGSAPGTRETDLLDPINLVNEVHAICLAGGSAYGLDASSGVMQFLEEKRIGLDVGVAKVPIVPSAILFDLAVGNPSVRPDQAMGYEASKQANNSKVTTGNVGAGTGATVGKVLGFDHASPSGIGSYSITLENGLVVGAIVAVNAFGDVIDTINNQILAGAINPESGEFINTASFLKKNTSHKGSTGTNTTIGVIGVNAKLSKAEAKKVSQMAQNAIGKTISPAHTMYDGDTIFTLATGDDSFSIDLIGSVAVEVMEKAIIQAVSKR